MVVLHTNGKQYKWMFETHLKMFTCDYDVGNTMLNISTLYKAGTSLLEKSGLNSDKRLENLWRK